jgi:serine-type D-Ala-D-Ala carboxypeptidase (penicillin-binding protein 5/6)
VWKGVANSVPAGFVADQYVALPKNEAQKLKLTLRSAEPLLAPVAHGQPVGTVYVTLEGKAIGEYPLVALADVPPAGLFGRLWDTLRLWFK